MQVRLAMVAGLAVLAAGCSSEQTTNTTTVNDTTVVVNETADLNAVAPAAGAVSANLLTATGAEAGVATVTATDGELKLVFDAKGLPAGTHGLHLHTVGSCVAPEFTSAGPHWNPTNKQHGSQNPQGAHAGDAPNLEIAADGTGKLETTLPGGTIAELLDADGAAIVVHASPDDLKTDPSGNSGARIACGVLTAS